MLLRFQSSFSAFVSLLKLLVFRTYFNFTWFCCFWAAQWWIISRRIDGDTGRFILGWIEIPRKISGILSCGMVFPVGRLGKLMRVWFPFNRMIVLRWDFQKLDCLVIPFRGLKIPFRDKEIIFSELAPCSYTLYILEFSAVTRPVLVGQMPYQ